MTIARFDPFSGASGDMILGALLDAGLAAAALREALAALPLAGYELVVERVERHGLTGSRIDVVVNDDATSRDWATIRALIAGSGLDPAVRDRALAVFGRLAAAEAAVHGVPVETVHFHEVGGVDAIVDIVGAVAGLALLGVDEVWCGPLRAGSGWVRAAHGMLPVPAPATARLVAAASAPLAGEPPGEPAGELLTPTGAAILRHNSPHDPNRKKNRFPGLPRRTPPRTCRRPPPVAPCRRIGRHGASGRCLRRSGPGPVSRPRRGRRPAQPDAVLRARGVDGTQRIRHLRSDDGRRPGAP